jgi:titin
LKLLLVQFCKYFFAVQAVNEFGIGEYIECKNVVRVAEVPAAPVRLQAAEIGDNSVTLEWPKSHNDGGSRVKEYSVFQKDIESKDDKKTASWKEVAKVKNSRCTVSRLRNGAEYQFMVKAKNDVGFSEGIQMLQSVIVKADLQAPDCDFGGASGLTFYGNKGQIIACKIKVRGKPFPTAQFKRDDVPLRETQRVNIEKTDEHVILNITSASYEDAGDYELILTNKAGTLTRKLTVVVYEKPSPPQNIRFSEIGPEGLQLSWDPPIIEGGCPIQNYVVEFREATSTVWTTVSAAVARRTLRVNRLHKDTEYIFRIRAENRFGLGQWANSDNVMAEFPFREPGAPSVPGAKAITKDSITVQWQEPIKTHGAKILGYH